MELLKPLASFPNNVSHCRLQNGDGYKVPVRLSLLRESLSKVEEEAFRRYSSLLSRVFLLGWLGLQMGRCSLGACLAFDRSGRGRLRGCIIETVPIRAWVASRARICSPRWSSDDWKSSMRS